MANTWTGCIQVNGYETTDYYINDFEVTDEEYSAICKAIECNMPLRELDCYYSLLIKAEHTVDLEKIYCDEADPARREAILEEFWIVDAMIYDPNDIVRLKNRFIGRPLKEDLEFEIEESFDRLVFYEVELITKNGSIVDLNLDVRGVQSIGIKRDSIFECYPNYEYLEEEIEEYLEELL